MRKSILMLALALMGSTLAKPFVQPDGVGALYFRDEGGSMLTLCTVSKVSSERFQTKLNRSDALLTASHCTIDLPYNSPSFTFASFDDGLSFIRLKQVVRGDLAIGYDFALWLPADEKGYVPYNAIKSYKISDRKLLDFGEDIDSWGQPSGLGLTYTKGIVAQPVVDRPIIDQAQAIDWVGMISADLHCTGGCSGSSVFDNKGEVIGILVGSLFDGTGFKHTYLVPTPRVFEALENDALTIPIDRKKDDTKDSKKTTGEKKDVKEIKIGQ